LALRDGFEFGQVVVVARARYLDGHLSERVDAVRVVQVVAALDLATAHAVVNDLLLVAQVSKVRAHVRPELRIFAALLVRTLLRRDGGAGRARQKDRKDKLEKAPLCSHRSPLPANADCAARLDSRLNLVGIWGFGTRRILAQFGATVSTRNCCRQGFLIIESAAWKNCARHSSGDTFAESEEGSVCRLSRRWIRGQSSRASAWRSACRAG